MKTNKNIVSSIAKLFLTFLAFCLIHCAYGQTMYKGYPVIKATVNSVDVKFGDYLSKNYWSILPEVEVDTLDVHFRVSKKLVFYTNVDSIIFTVNNEYLELLRSKFPIDSIVKNAQTDMDKTLKNLNWVA